MSITTRNKKDWFEIINNLVEPEEPDGFFVIFFPHNIHHNEIYNKRAFVEKFKHFLIKHKIRYIRLSQPYYDRCELYTTCNKKIINYIDNEFQNEFNVREDRIMWFGMHEHDNEWKNGSLLQLISHTFNAYGKKLSAARVKPNQNILSLKLRTFQKFYEEKVMTRNSLVVKPVFSPLDYKEKKNTVFVLMPFNEDWSENTYALIKEAGEATGINVLRADDFFEPNIIMDDIWININQSSLILADISVHNANVFYELGIAHTIGKKVIMIKQKNDISAPFDIKAWRYIEYELMPIQAKRFVETLTKIFQQLCTE